MKFKYIFLVLSIFIVGCGTPIVNNYDSPTPPDAIVRGNPYASVTITEYTNFVCSACLVWNEQIIKPLIEELGDEVVLAFVHYPFGLHGMSDEEVMKLHIASECANEQDKFWEYHDLLFEKQKTDDISSDMVSEYAAELSLDISSFDQCIAEDRYKDKIESYKERGIAYGISSTPTFFINDMKFELDENSQLNPLEQFKEVIRAVKY